MTDLDNEMHDPPAVNRTLKVWFAILFVWVAAIIWVILMFGVHAQEICDPRTVVSIVHQQQVQIPDGIDAKSTSFTGGPVQPAVRPEMVTAHAIDGYVPELALAPGDWYCQSRWTPKPDRLVVCYRTGEAP